MKSERGTMVRMRCTLSVPEIHSIEEDHGPAQKFQLLERRFVVEEMDSPPTIAGSLEAVVGIMVRGKDDDLVPILLEPKGRIYHQAFSSS